MSYDPKGSSIRVLEELLFKVYGDVSVPRALTALIVMTCTASALYGQKQEQVRTWKGLLGSTSFGVFSSDGRRLVYADGRAAVIADTVDGGNEVSLAGHMGRCGSHGFQATEKRSSPWARTRLCESGRRRPENRSARSLQIHPVVARP